MKCEKLLKELDYSLEKRDIETKLKLETILATLNDPPTSAQQAPFPAYQEPLTPSRRRLIQYSEYLDYPPAAVSSSNTNSNNYYAAPHRYTLQGMQVCSYFNQISVLLQYPFTAKC